MLRKLLHEIHQFAEYAEEALDRLEEEVDRLMERAFLREAEAIAHGEAIEPLYNVLVQPDEVRILVDMPFVDERSIRISAHKNMIEVYGEARRPFHLSEISERLTGVCRCYRAAIDLPVDVDTRSTTLRLIAEGLVEIRVKRVRIQRPA